jgi:uncharacterized protein DUF2252
VFLRGSVTFDCFDLRRFARRQVLALGIVLLGTPCAVAQLRPEAEAIRLAPPELIARLQASPMDYFRFVNRPWVERVCDAFADEVSHVPSVRLHGDAHIEQYAVTNDAWGLDDFDNSARGPALVDMIRFLGSIDLALRQRGWTGDRPALFNRFFAGYRRGLVQPDYRPPQPDIVARLRAQAPPSRLSFLAWGEAKMEPMDEASMKAVVAGMDATSRAVQAQRPDLPAGYFNVVGAGWLHMGVGSSETPKVLIRIRGRSTDPEDDELLEAKEFRSLGGLRCIEAPPPVQPANQVIETSRQIGRLKHNILAAGPELVLPELVVRGRQLHAWWIRSWDPSYRELTVSDFRSVQELSAIVYDSGMQLGAGRLKEEADSRAAVRTREIASLDRLELRIRNEARRLVEQVLLGWKEFGASGLDTLRVNQQ